MAVITRTNLATNPSFEADGDSIPGPVVRTNRAFDPHARNEPTDHWQYAAGDGGAVTSTYETGTDTPDGESGFFRTVIDTAATGGTEGPRYRQDGTESGVAGDVWTFSFYYRSTTTALNPINVVAAFRSGGATVNNETSSIDAVVGEWVRASVTITASGAYDGFQLWVNENTGGEPQAGDTIDVTQMLAERTDVLRSYFDYDSLIFTDHPEEPFWTWIEPGGTDDDDASYMVPNGTAPISGAFVIDSVLQFDADETGGGGLVAGSSATQNVGHSNYGVRSRDHSIVVVPTGEGSNGSTAYPADGFMDSMGQLGLEPGKTYTISGYITLESPQESTNLNSLARRIRVREPGESTFGTSDPAPNEAGQHRVSVTFTVPETATNAILELFCGSDLPVDLVWWDDILIEETSVLDDYFDGSFQNTSTCVYNWENFDPDNGTSTEMCTTATTGAWGISFNGVAFEGGEKIVPTLLDPNQGDARVGIMGCLTEPPEGLGLPELRTGDVTLPERDGVVQTTDWYTNRFVTLQVTVSAPGCDGCLSAKEMVYNILSAWSRACDLTHEPLVIYTDCHDPSNPEKRHIIGPFAVYGRPRVADVTWRGGGVNVADITLRWDSQDQRIVVLPENYRAYGPGQGAIGVFSQQQVTIDDNSSEVVNPIGNVCADAMYILNGTLTGPVTVRTTTAGFVNEVTYAPSIPNDAVLFLNTRTGRATLRPSPGASTIDVTVDITGDISALRLEPLELDDTTIEMTTGASNSGNLVVEWFDAVNGI